MFQLYQISYDLNGEHKDYSGLIDAIKTLSGTWAKPVESTWIVYVDMTADEIYQRLCPHIDKDDRIIVSVMGSDYQGWLKKVIWDWLRPKVA